MLPSDVASYCGPVASVEPIGGSGSNRRYQRVILTNGEELIATEGTNIAENEAFFYFAELLFKAGVSVPRVLWISKDRMRYVQTSLGRTALFECLNRLDLIEKTIDLLARAHCTRGIDYSRCYPIAAMDRRAIMWDLNYFKYCFLKPTPGMEIDESGLEDDFERLTEIILSAEPRGLMLRDFQSRNVMVNGDEVGLIDFQGARLGAAHYDVASFLWQARAGFSDELKSEMVSRYCCARSINESEFCERLPYFVALRLLQALGAYGLRGRLERKEHFLLSIPPALNSLSGTLDNLPISLLTLKAAVNQAAGLSSQTH